MTTVSAISFRQHVFQLLLQVVETGEPLVIAYARREQGKTKATLYRVEFLPD